MASGLKFKRTTTEKVTVKGCLSDDCNSIEYTDENDILQEVLISDLLHSFRGEQIDLSLSLKDEEDLEVADATTSE